MRTRRYRQARSSELASPKETIIHAVRGSMLRAASHSFGDFRSWPILLQKSFESTDEQ